MQYEHIASLEEFLAQVEQRLFSIDNRFAVAFPSSAISPWDGDALVHANQKLLKSVSGEANVYAIFTALSGTDEHSLRYVGKSTKKLARQRITNHLFRKDKRTGSKLAEVSAHAASGGSVQIAWLSVQPESLRNYLEEEIILRHPEADWNRENKRNGSAISKSQPSASET